MSSSNMLKKAKANARSALRQVRDEIPGDEREKMAAAISERLAELVRGAPMVMIFLSFGSEVPTDLIADRLTAEGHYLAVPWIEGREAVPVKYRPGDALEPGAFGIREPVRHEPVDPSELDAVVAPGLGFDRGGRRLGYGGGYYDRLLRRLRPEAMRMGVGFHQQVIDKVPGDRHDELLDLIVTDNETIVCKPGP